MLLTLLSLEYQSPFPVLRGKGDRVPSCCIPQKRCCQENLLMQVAASSHLAMPLSRPMHVFLCPEQPLPLR